MTASAGGLPSSPPGEEGPVTLQASNIVDTLRTRITGKVVGPDDDGYDAARTVWNADIDRRPALVAQCSSPADVVAAVQLATEHDLEIAVRAGAHSMSGASVVDAGLMIDLSSLNQVTVDPTAKRARVGGGALLGDLDAATLAHGLAVPAGLVSHTGVAGLTLGGGMGWLSRKAGLTIDNLLSAEVVTADGRVLRASADEHPDLFWALRGGGGNFGVVTEFEFALHEIDPIVQFAMMFWDLGQLGPVLRRAREVMAVLSPDVNIVVAGLNAPPAPFVPQEHQMTPGVALLVTGFGSAEEHSAVLETIRAGLPPLFESVAPMPYVALQQMLDEGNAWGFHCYDKGCYIEDFTDEVIEVLAAHLPKKTSPLSVVLFYRLDHAYSAVPDAETAFSGGRSPRYGVFMVGVCPTAEQLPREREWVRSLADAMQPVAIGNEAYVNGLTDLPGARVRASYGPETYERLARIKATYDPRNVFHRNANIEPATA